MEKWLTITGGRRRDPSWDDGAISQETSGTGFKMRSFATGATRDQDATKPDYEGYLSPLVLQRFGAYMTEHRVQANGALRDSDNWQKGIPRDQYLKSLLRHVVELWSEHRDRLRDGEVTVPARDPKIVEDALCAILFNAQGYLHEWLLNRDVGAIRQEQVWTPLSWGEWLAANTSHGDRKGCQDHPRRCYFGNDYKEYLIKGQPGVSK